MEAPDAYLASLAVFIVLLFLPQANQTNFFHGEQIFIRYRIELLANFVDKIVLASQVLFLAYTGFSNEAPGQADHDKPKAGEHQIKLAFLARFELFQQIDDSCIFCPRVHRQNYADKEQMKTGCKKESGERGHFCENLSHSLLIATVYTIAREKSSYQSAVFESHTSYLFLKAVGN